MTRSDHRTESPRIAVLTAFGTRPELIKLGPVLAELEARADQFATITVNTGQHAELLVPFLNLFGTRVDADLKVMRPGQPLNALFARLVADIDPILASSKPDIVLLQGDTTTAAAVALAAFQRRIPIGHVEAGLRTDDIRSPFPEEMNRRLIGRIASLHFAGTKNHVRTLRKEGVSRESIFRTGNPVVDALQFLGRRPCSPKLRDLLDRTKHLKRIAFTSHRRENFAELLEGNLRVVRRFLERHADTAVLFPMHPNPVVRDKALDVLGGVERAFLLEPLDYPDFIRLLSESWLIASDSGGVQEETPSLGVPLIVLRESTERTEVLDTGLAELAPTPARFAELLNDRYWSNESVQTVANPFGDGRAAKRIANALVRVFGTSRERERPEPLWNAAGAFGSSAPRVEATP